MAQPVIFEILHLGSIEVEPNKEYFVSEILLKFPTAKFLILKTKTDPREEQITVSINETPYFPIEYNEHSAIKPTGDTRKFMFTRKCIIAVAESVTV